MRTPTKEETIKARCFLEMHLRVSYSVEALAQLLADHAEEALTFGDLPRYRPPPAEACYAKPCERCPWTTCTCVVRHG